MRAVVRSVFVIAVATCVALVTYVVLVATSLMWVGSHHSTTTSDAIVVMGAAQYDGVPSPLLASRLQHAFDL